MHFRLVEESDARGILDAHHNSIRFLAKKDYPPEIIDEWASLPITDNMVKNYIEKAMKEEATIVALLENKVVGFASVILANGELRAVYVDPSVACQGVGSELLKRIEAIAQQNGVTELHMPSSLSAEAFYLKHGYKIIERGEHTLSSGKKMACVRMSKLLPR